MNMVGLISAIAMALLLVGASWRLDKTSTALASAQTEMEGLRQAAVVTGELLAAAEELDSRHTQELQDVQNRNDDFRRAAESGTQRLSVPVKCPTRPATRASSVDNETVRADLDPAAGGRIIGLTSEGDQAIVALTALQEYVTRICKPTGTSN